MPWNVLGYRFFNTVIDDIFSFIIKMPTMHRAACFRDDIIFVLYMMQRWWYPIDRTRPAEGFDVEEAAAEAAAHAKERDAAAVDGAAAASAAVKARVGTVGAAVAGVDGGDPTPVRDSRDEGDVPRAAVRRRAGRVGP
jgi:hypothetical protein